MLSPKLVNCIDCTTPQALISDIDCRLTELANNQYNNIVFILNLPFPGQVIDDLLNYKRILTYKLCNPNYASAYTVQMIASRVKVLIHK
jgi:hypothetical protein